MQWSFTRRSLGVFICAMGSVCAGPAIGQTQVELADESEEVVELFGPDEQQDEPAAPKVEVGAFGQIDLQVKDLEVVDVLRLLSMQSKKNIIASRNVSGKVSANLFGVDFYQALDAILQPNGFGYREEGDFIYVYTAEELKKIEDAMRKTITVPVTLNYLNAEDAKTIIEAVLSGDGAIAHSSAAPAGFQPSLSEGGADSYAGDATIVITDYEENIEEALALIEHLDVRPKQVLIEASIVQARLTEDNAFGVDFSVFADVDIDTFSTPLGAVNEIISGDTAVNSGQVVNSTVGNTAGPAGVKLGFLGSEFAVFVRALDSVTDTTVLSMPKILTLNRQRAELLVGARLGYLNTTVTESSRTSSVEFLETGTQLTVRPFISNDGFVRLELRPSVSTGDTDRVVEGNVIPREDTQELVTNVIIRSGQTLVLGGLFTEDTTISRDQIPGLGDIPLAGAAFQGQTDAITRSEVIFLIKPTVIHDNSLYAQGEEVKSEINNLRAGVREGLLPWSRTKLTQSHMKRALELLDEGDKDRALWNINLVLAINPTASDALKLRSTLTGQQVYVRDESIWNRAAESAIDAEIKKIMPELIEIDEAVEETPVEESTVEEAVEETMEEAPAEEVIEEAVEEAVEEETVEEVSQLEDSISQETFEGIETTTEAEFAADVEMQTQDEEPVEIEINKDFLFPELKTSADYEAPEPYKQPENVNMDFFFPESQSDEAQADADEAVDVELVIEETSTDTVAEQTVDFEMFGDDTAPAEVEVTQAEETEVTPRFESVEEFEAAIEAAAADMKDFIITHDESEASVTEVPTTQE